jgi:MerR family copper efflux transcriptional regulator
LAPTAAVLARPSTFRFQGVDLNMSLIAVDHNARLVLAGLDRTASVCSAWQSRWGRVIGRFRLRAEEGAMLTIGGLSRQTGVPVRVLREYEDLGLIYTAGRSAGNYRLFDAEALWCVGVVGTLRTLGLTLGEIRELAGSYLGPTGENIGPRLAGMLGEVRARTQGRITELHQLLQRIDDFETGRAAELAGRADFRAQDPHFGQAQLDSPPGGRP